MKKLLADLDLSTQMRPLPYYEPQVCESSGFELSGFIKEWSLLHCKETSNNKMSVYIHIPFCSNVCNFCVLHQGASSKLFSETYTKKILEGINYFAKVLNERGVVLEALSIGGGTPTSIKSEYLSSILSAIEKFQYKSNAEITIESTFTDFMKKRKLLKASIINRISFGLQIASDERCSILGRQMSLSESEKVLYAAADDNYEVTVDLMYGLQNVVQTDLKKCCEWLLDKPISGVDLNRFVSVSGTLLHNKGVVNLDAEKDAERLDEFLDAVQLLKDNSFSWVTPFQLSKNSKNSFSYERIWYQGGDCLAIGTGVQGRLEKKQYHISYEMDKFLASTVNEMRVEVRSYSKSMLPYRDTYYNLMKGKLKDESRYQNSVTLNILEEHNLLEYIDGHYELQRSQGVNYHPYSHQSWEEWDFEGRRLLNYYLLTDKGRYYISNIAEYLIGNCIR